VEWKDKIYHLMKFQQRIDCCNNYEKDMQRKQ